MAQGRSGGYGGYGGYGGSNNPYSGQGIITRRSPFSEPFVDFSTEFGKRSRSWLGLHMPIWAEMEKNIAAGKKKYIDDVAAFAEKGLLSANTDKEHQVGGGKVTGPGGVIDQIEGEHADLQFMVDDYAEKYRAANNITGKYYKRGKKKGEFKKYQGFGAGPSATDKGIDARADLKRIEGAVENAKAGKILYNEIQSEFYNDAETQRIIGAQTSKATYDKFIKFIDQDNHTRFDRKTGEMYVVAKNCEKPPCEISVGELAKLKPGVSNDEMIQKVKSDINLITKPENVTNVVSPSTESVQEMKVDPKTGKSKWTGKMVDRDISAIDIGKIYDHVSLALKGKTYEDYLDLIHNDVTTNFDGSVTQTPFTSNEFMALQAIYHTQSELDFKNSESLNYKLLTDRHKEFGFTLEDKFTNDQNFIIDQKIFVEGTEERNKFLAHLKLQKEEKDITEVEYNNALEYVGHFGKFVNGHHIQRMQGNNQPIHVVATDAYKRYQVGRIEETLKANLKASQQLTFKQERELVKEAQAWEKLSQSQKKQDHDEKMDNISNAESDFTLMDHIGQVFDFKLGNDPNKIKNEDLMTHFSGLPMMDGNNRVGTMNLAVINSDTYPNQNFLNEDDVIKVMYNSDAKVEKFPSGNIKKSTGEDRKPYYIKHNGDLETLKAELNKAFFEWNPGSTSFPDEVAELERKKKILEELEKRKNNPG